jgi:hypothetical protein
MSQFAPLVHTLFTLQGYEPEPNAGTHVLLFRRRQERVALRVREGKDPLPAYVATEIAEALPLFGHAVLVCFGDIGHEARAILERAGVDVWTRDKLIHEVGQAMIEAAEQQRLPPVGAAGGLPGPAPAPTAPAAPPREPLWTRSAAGPAAAPGPRPAAAVQAAPAGPPSPAIALPAAPLATPPPSAPTASGPPAQPLSPTLVTLAAPAAPPASGPAPAAPGVLALAVDREAALRIGVGRLLRVDKAALELLPVYAFGYACRLEAKGAPPQAKQGLLAVDAVTASVRELPEPQFGPCAEPAGRLAAMVPEPDAADLVKRKVVELHTQKVRIKNNLGRGAAIVADQWVRPDPRSIVLEPRGTWFLPIWRLEGQNGSLRVNGATGAVEEEKLKRAFATDAEFL